MKYLSLLVVLAFTPFLQAQSDFPAGWAGIWEGDLVISQAGVGEVQRISMQLHLLPLEDSTYTFTLIYGEPTEENTRPYRLYPRDEAAGHFLTDEKNGIVLDDFLINDKLYSRFEVMGTLLLTTLERQGDQLIYEIIAGPMEPIQTTGDTVVEGEEIPPVNSYQIRVQQRAVLSRRE